MEDPQTRPSDDLNARLLAALDQDLGRRARLGLEQDLMIEALRAENRQLRLIGQRLMEQHAPGKCQPAESEAAKPKASAVEAREAGVVTIDVCDVPIPEPSPNRYAGPGVSGCPACTAEAGG